MTESLITEWLADCKDVAPSELHVFARTLSQDNEIVRALYVLLEERTKYSELMDEVCNQLYNFYRSRELELQRFTLQFLPTLIHIYLNSAAHGDIKSCRSLETLLIGLYNLEVVDKSGQQKAISFRLPSLAMLSIYHEPASLAPASLTESAVRRFEECNSKLVSWGPLQQVETLNAQNRLKVMTALLFIYNQQLGYINKFALEQLCKVATKLVTQGFMKPGHHQRSSYGSESSFVPRLLPRIPVSSQFLLEFLHAVYFAMYNECWYVGNQAIEDIHNRACYEAYPNVMLVTNAIRNSASSGAPGQPNDGPIGISVALSPATTTTPTVSKSMITNASFRTKKLPDDIPIQVVKDETTGEGKGNLVSIMEEPESTEPNRIGSMRQSKDQKTASKITNFPVLGKKPKEKEGKVTKNAHVASSEKEKKLGSQATSKESIKGNLSMLNSEQQAEIDGNVNGCAIRKKNNIENNSIIIDPNVALIDGERLALSSDVTDGSNMENSINLRAHNETESLGSSIQISSV
ncbi:PI4KA lipid kinase complex subunit hyccin isoform X1 [Temnothorax americanus]|uniref:PI4KA lipid kinase complex subunit hyccin isoform X1 n=1 Tax=Temnothorax americanus TaxID=1964332 RepID=UPI004067DF93